MQLNWKKGDPFMFVDTGSNVLKIAVTNNVRKRDLQNPEDVVYTIPGGRPYMPRTFPLGIWKILGVRSKDNPYLAPYFIVTDAWQTVEEWSLDDEGTYLAPTGRMVGDSGYGIHFSTSSTTLGCLKVINKSDIVLLAKMIDERIKKEAITFTVTA